MQTRSQRNVHMFIDKHDVALRVVSATAAHNAYVVCAKRNP